MLSRACPEVGKLHSGVKLARCLCTISRLICSEGASDDVVEESICFDFKRLHDVGCASGPCWYELVRVQVRLSAGKTRTCRRTAWQ